jgi:hypothetical protein
MVILTARRCLSFAVQKLLAAIYGKPISQAVECLPLNGKVTLVVEVLWSAKCDGFFPNRCSGSSSG